TEVTAEGIVRTVYTLDCCRADAATTRSPLLENRQRFSRQYAQRLRSRAKKPSARTRFAPGKADSGNARRWPKFGYFWTWLLRPIPLQRRANFPRPVRRRCYQTGSIESNRSHVVAPSSDARHLHRLKIQFACYRSSRGNEALINS